MVNLMALTNEIWDGRAVTLKFSVSSSGLIRSGTRC
jgi:hypothetical protein